MTTILKDIMPLLYTEVLACLIVLLAMIIDLGSGLYKAKLRGDATRSEALKRSIIKFITYEGGLLIAAGIDTLVFFCHFWQIIKADLLLEVPVITCLTAIFLLVVEGLSVKEKADEKTHAQMRKVQEAAGTIISKSELAEAIAAAIINSKKED